MTDARLSERAATVAWLRRRAALTVKHMAPRWRPLRRRFDRAMAGTFTATADLVERGAHVATWDEETIIIREARAAMRDSGGHPEGENGEAC